MRRRGMLGRAIGFAALLLAFGITPVAAAPPATNDAFATAKVVSQGALPYTDEVDSTAATTEAGEVASECYGLASRTVWYRINPTSSGYLRADTFGSGHDGILSVWKGTTMATLTEVACNRYASIDELDSRVAFRVIAGTRYYVRISGSTGLTVLHLKSVTPPSNDAFANARNVGALPFSHATSNLNATLQAGEPDPLPSNCSRTGSTLWYRFAPSSTMVVRADVLLTGIDTWIRAFRGTALDALTPLVCNDDTGPEGSGSASSIAFKVVAGSTYYIQVGGYGGETGNLAVRIAKGTPPAGDAFAAALAIASNGALHEIDSTRNATWQPAEPDPTMGDCGTSPSSSSVWYRHTPSFSTNVRFDTFGSDYTTTIAVYTGSGLGSLTEVGCDVGNDSLIFSASTGTTYFVQVSGAYGESGHLHAHLLAP